MSVCITPLILFLRPSSTGACFLFFLFFFFHGARDGTSGPLHSSRQTDSCQCG
jgi:hypothetical protein